MIIMIADKKLFLFSDRGQIDNSTCGQHQDALQKAEYEEALVFIEVKDLELVDMRGEV